MSGAGQRPLGPRGRWTLAGIGAGIVALLAVANVHLVTVSLSSDPGCVAHRTEPGDADAGTLRAARSDC
ncbi:hypothetical protein [Roseicyclus sp.]|uniref:hypothetical protein n=1 Tax=Roseicyclus sp. TaxID=1914329 RepID=UPI003FA090FC